jgi:flagellar protein FlbD
MIILTKIDGTSIVVNADEIETVESMHESVISLKTGKKIIVTESSDEIIQKVIEYRIKCNISNPVLPDLK